MSIWVFIEEREEIYSLLKEANRIAQALGEECWGISFGGELFKFAGYGLKKLLWVKSPFLEEYSPELYTDALEKIIRKYAPEIFLFLHSPKGRELAPRVSARLRTGLITDCIEVRVNNKEVYFIKPLYRGILHASFYIPQRRPQMATLKPSSLPKTEAPFSDKGMEILQEEVVLSPERKRTFLIEKIPGKPEEMDVTEAERIVAAGRGAGNQEGISLIKELSSFLQASIGCTRPLVDEGVFPLERQIGMTGKTVSPQLFFACGISGSVHFVGGMQESKFIIAINKDKNAPIFRICDLGAVGDLKEILPALLKVIKGEQI